VVDIPVVLTVTCTAVSDLAFSFSPETPSAGELITFNATASGTLPILFAWDFGDGITGSGDVVTHTFDVPGTYTVTLTAENCTGELVVVESTITVLPAAESWNTFLPIVGKT